ncbi:MAG: phosphopyruvate hydratase [Bryobacterales bacterium]|nr:phosphopyruvate hydratase [Bryobacterales bacterium]
MSRIHTLTASEILDSRGRPTIRAICTLTSGASAAASVPSGASTGEAEARELRDGDARRYRGLGCRRAVANINEEISRAIAGRECASQADLDNFLIDLDGTHNKARLGANAILAVSISFARAVAAEKEMPLYLHFASLLGRVPETLPRLTINLFSGGKHAGKQVAIQDVLAVPVSPSTVDGSLVMMYDVYQAAAGLIYQRYGMRLLTADEGGLAPPADSAEALVALAVESIEAAGYRPGEDVAIALDVASSHFYSDGVYTLDRERMSSVEMIAMLESWAGKFPIVSIEDGLAENDWSHWPALRQTLDRRVLVLGDDFLCTNPSRIERAIGARACDALLLKVNQVGTLTEALHALRLARSAGWMVTVSVRSGETEDNWAADLAVGWCGDQFKNGSITQSERLSKYNRLLAIEDETGWPITAWPGRAAGS